MVIFECKTDNQSKGNHKGLPLRQLQIWNSFSSFLLFFSEVFLVNG